VDRALDLVKYRITDPPQYETRIIPCIMRDNRDMRQDTLEMLEKICECLPEKSLHGAN